MLGGQPQYWSDFKQVLDCGQAAESVMRGGVMLPPVRRQIRASALLSVLAVPSW